MCVCVCVARFINNSCQTRKFQRRHVGIKYHPSSSENLSLDCVGAAFSLLAAPAVADPDVVDRAPVVAEADGTAVG